eukprot:1161893-Pelagomonas_calceolata.AAC.3
MTSGNVGAARECEAGTVRERVHCKGISGRHCKGELESRHCKGMCALQGIVMWALRRGASTASSSQYFDGRPFILKPEARWRSFVLTGGLVTCKCPVRGLLHEPFAKRIVRRLIVLLASSFLPRCVLHTYQLQKLQTAQSRPDSPAAMVPGSRSLAQIKIETTGTIKIVKDHWHRSTGKERGKTWLEVEPDHGAQMKPMQVHKTSSTLSEDVLQVHQLRRCWPPVIKHLKNEKAATFPIEPANMAVMINMDADAQFTDHC